MSTASIVASCGWIIPEPFAIPPTVNPSSVTAASFVFVSVVRIASAASGPPSAESAGAASRRPPSTFSSGSSAPITPVERTSTSSASRSSSRPASAAVASASSSPRSPVAAFATPELIDDRLRLGRREMLLRDDDRRGEHLVDGEHRRPDRGHGRADDGEVEPLAADARVHAGGGEPLRGGDAHHRALRRAAGRPSRAARARGSRSAPPGRRRPCRGCRARRRRCPCRRAVGEDADLGRVGALDARELGRDALRQHASRRARRRTPPRARRAGPPSRSRNRWRAARASPAADAGRSRPGSRAPARSRGRAGASRPCMARRSRAPRSHATTPSASAPRRRRPTSRRRRLPSGSIASDERREREQDGGGVAARVRDQRPVGGKSSGIA